MRRIVLAMTGASGMPYGVRLLEVLSRTPEVETHLILSNAALKVLSLESEIGPDELAGLAHRTYAQDEVGAGPASGSWIHHGMAVCPCSMASLAAIANGLGSNLIHRAADVTLKEKRPLILVARETPLNRTHLKNMLAAHDAGCVIMPPSPGFYHRPRTIKDLTDQFVGRILDHLGIEHELGVRWKGDSPESVLLA